MKYSLFSALFLLMSNLASAQLQLSFSTVSPTCNGFTNGTATALPTGGTEPYAYNWSNGQSGQTTLGIGAGTYSVTVTDAANLTITGEVTVTAPAPLTAAIAPEGLGCTDTEGTLVANPSGGTGPYTYAWENGTTGSGLPVSQSGLYYVTVTDANGCSALANYFVRPAAEIVVQFLGLDAPSCANSSDGSISVNVFGNAAPYTWVWQNGSAAATLTNIPAGNYSVTATDVNGCTKVGTGTLNAPPQLIVDVISTNIPCATLPNGGAVHAGVAGGVNPYTFLWNTGSVESGLLNVQQGTYTVTVTDKNGCTATDEGTVTQPPPLTASIVTITPACGGSNGSATITASGGTPPYIHNWSNGQTGLTATNLAPGQYYVCTFDANMCQFDLWVVIPSLPGLDVSLTITKAECPGVNNGTATAIVNPPGGNYSYSWSVPNSPNISQINSIPANTAVSVTVTDLNSGCQGVATGVVGTHNQVEVDVTHTDAACGASTGSAVAVASLGVAPYNYVWTYPNTTQVTGPNISDLAPGLYSVTATDTRGCTAVGVADVMSSGAATAAFTMNGTDCTASNVGVQFTDQSPNPSTITSWSWVFSWNGNVILSDQQNPTITFPNGASGTAQLTINTVGGCTATVTQPFSVGTPNAPGVAVDSEPGVNCENPPPAEVHIVALSNDYTYQWIPADNITFVTPNGQDVLADPDETTEYQVIVSNGVCKDTVPVLITRYHPPVISLETNAVVTCDSTAVLSATATENANIKWLNGTTQVGTGNSITVPAGQTVNYTVVATNSIGCTDIETVSVTGNRINVDAAINQPVSGCENTPLTLQVTNLDPNDTLTYQWSSSSPALTITPQNASQVTVSGPAGSYTVIVTVANQFNCQQTFTTQVTMTPGQMLTGAITADVCNGLQVAFENTSTVQGTWNFGDNTTPSNENDPTHTYAQAGNYNVTFVSSQACVAPFATEIQVLSEALQVSAASTLAACVDSATVQFTSQVSGGLGLSGLQWNFSNGGSSTAPNPSVIVTQAGPITGTLIATATNGCADTTTVQAQVDLINESVSETFNFCAPNAVALNPDFNQTYTYTWTATPADPNLQANNPNPSVSPASPTTYSVNITNGLCSVSYNALVTPREAAVLELPGDQVVCSAAPVTVTVQNTNAATIKWSTSPTLTPVIATGPTTVISPVPNGMYFVEGTNEAGCKALDSILINNASINVVAKSPERDICKTFSTELTLVNGMPDQQLTYEWNQGLPPVPNPMVTPLSDANYEVRVTNQYGCKDTLSFFVNVTDVAVTAEVTGPDTICVGQTTRLLATASGNASVYTYQWAPAATLDHADVADPVAEPQETTDYIVTVLGDGMCPASAKVTVYFMDTECAEPYIFVPKAFTPNGDNNNDNFIVRGANIKELHFIVWDRWGEQVYETKDIDALGWDGTFKGKELTPDSYAWYLEVTCGNGATFVNKGNVTLLK